MQHPPKAQFLKTYGFPPEWETWGFYPDELFESQLCVTADDEDPHPDEHLRYGAFSWWIRQHRELSAETLIQLCQLAALDPDPPMSGAAIRDIMFHPTATEEVAMAAAELAELQNAWVGLFTTVGKREYFNGLLNEGRQFWAERQCAHLIAVDLRDGLLEESALREAYAIGSPLVMLGLVEHPKLPSDMLLQLAELRSGRFSKAIRSMAAKRLSGKSVAPTDYSARYSTDPWLWSR